jgi:hypothetical protein
MRHKQALRRVGVAMLAAIAFACQGTWALAGTTGGMSGLVTDLTGKPVADAAVKAVSAQQAASTTTDGKGHFSFLTLAPDTYTVSIEKAGYEPLTVPGITIFADQQQTLAFRMQQALKVIAHVTSTAPGALVKSGVGADLYNVSATSISKSSALGGGGNLNSAYSAISSVPGVTVGAGGMGWNQATYVRGSQSFFTGFEYDGVPVNRAFDNYVASTESNTGLQELEVYTGGGPSSNSSSGTSGFINQVIKTGTYPGYGTLTGGIGTPTFYHQAKVEAGGATPDRRFSYYVGISGYNQDFRDFDNYNGADLMAPGDVYAGYSPIATTYPRSDLPLCIPGTATTPSSVTSLPWFSTDVSSGTNCLIPYPGSYGNGAQTGDQFLSNPAQIADRENVINFHFGIPRKNGLTDDLQLLWSASSMNTTAYSSPDDAGGYGLYTLAVTGLPYSYPGSAAAGAACLAAGTCNYPHYVDAVVYNAPFDTPISGLNTVNYFQPSSNPNRAFDAELPANLRDGYWNDTGIVKLQYTHELTSNAFVRAFAYTFFSDWTQAGANSAWNAYENSGVGPADYDYASANYDLITHTGGGELQFTDQLSSEHLIQLTGNYTTANVVRFNNDGFTGGSSPIGLVSYSKGVFQCWDPTTGGPAVTMGAVTGCAPGGSYESDSVSGPTGTPPAGSPAAAAGAQWVTLWNGESSGSFNTVKPQFTFASLSDQFRPSDKWLFNLALRYDNYKYGLNSAANLATQFYSQIVDNDVCVNPAGTVYSSPLAPGQPPPAPTIYTPTCPSGFNHPKFSGNSPTSYTIDDWSPRFSATYTQSPDTVWRVSAGRFTQPPISASVQYLSNSGNELSIWNATLPLGFNSPFHPIPAMSAAQYDLSLEHHLRGTNVSFKITPFYNMTTAYQEQSYIGPNFVTQAPVGLFRSMGVEGSLQAGNFAANGFSGQVAVTFTNARVKYQYYYGANQIVSTDTAIQQYNALTSACGPGGKAVGLKQYGMPVCGSASYLNPGGTTVPVPAAQCYSPATVSATTGLTPGAPAACTGNAIQNPYYNAGVQSLMDPNAWYAPGTLGLSPTSNPFTTYFDSPWNGTMILNYRHDKWAITPSIQVVQGSAYGGPMDVVGYDPRTCAANSSALGSNIVAVSPKTNPLQCDYLSTNGTISSAAGQLFVPNPQTGAFASPGVYRNPWLMVGNLQFSYDVSPKVSAQVTLANLFHSCFGGSKEPWTSAYAPGQYFCGYTPNLFYVGNYYNGTSATDFAANGTTPYPWQQQSYVPSNGSSAGVVPSPFDVFFQVNVKM